MSRSAFQAVVGSHVRSSLLTLQESLSIGAHRRDLRSGAWGGLTDLPSKRG